MNNKRFAAEILKIIEQLNFKDFIHFCDSDMYRSFYLKEFLKPSLFIYYIRDNLLAVKFWQTQGKRIEPILMAKADIIMANSVFLARLAEKHNKRSFFVGQGCDLSLFSPDQAKEIPSDLKSVKKPVIGYIGALKSLRLDLSIITHIAQTRPDWQIVLIGPEDDTFKNSPLHSFKNVHFLGSKNEILLPQYLQCFDVAINPQVINEVTVGNYPRKIDEYLSMGKPVVATKTEAMEYFNLHVSLAENKESWVNLIEKELNENTPEKAEKRIQFARAHSWNANAGEIYKLIEEFLSDDLKKQN